MRLFIAIRFSEEILDALEEIQEDWRMQGVFGNYTKTENLHLTLAFIGEYPDPELIREIISQVRFKPFRLRLEGLGSFGSRLWWAGLSESAELKSVVRQLRHLLAEADVPFDRKKFSPHITLVRKPQVPKGLTGGRDEVLVPASVPGAEMIVDHISLMRSDRGKNGMIYTEL